MVKDDRLQQQGVLNVKKSHLMAVLALCVAGGVVWMSLAGSPAVAQQGQPTAWPPTPIALIDINAIFKEHPTFKGEMTQINDDMGRADAKVKTESQDLQHCAITSRITTRGALSTRRRKKRLSTARRTCRWRSRT